MTPSNHNESLAHDLIEAGNARFQAAAHPKRVLFWTADASGSCEVVSVNWAEYTGQALEAATGSGWLDVAHPDDRSLVTDALRQAIQSHRGFYLHYRLQRADGSARRILHVASARMSPTGQFNGLVGTLTDESASEEGARNLAESEEHVFQFLEGVGLAAITITLAGKLLHINQVMATRIGRSPIDLIGTDWVTTHVVQSDRPSLQALFAGNASLAELPQEIEYQVDTPDGACLFRWHLTLIRDSEGAPVSIAMMGSDITQWRRWGEQLRLNSQVFDSSSEAMVISDRDNNIITVNSAFTRLTGYTLDEARGCNPRILKSGKHDAEFYKTMWDSIVEHGYWRGDIWDKRKDGTLYPKFLSITAISDASGAIDKYSAVFYDVSERKQWEAKLEQIAHYDELTGLPNRMLLHDRLERAIVAAERQQQRFALLFIDLDGFKPINDCYGHAAGDEVLRRVGQRLTDAVRAADTAARLGGDEFVVILTDIQARENAERIAEKIITAISEPYEIAGETLSLSASIGVSIYPNNETVAKELLRTADEAMYHAKRDGKSRVFFYSAPAS